MILGIQRGLKLRIQQELRRAGKAKAHPDHTRMMVFTERDI
uniref:Uncharacterized protein n=3 Tax=Enterobacteriaceae TaxID=543 RepID=A0A0E3DS12_ECOLX|nr:hypothetical protein [Escherichia coli]QHJ90631.1 hypothetical protein [Klebsiella aerogenes]QHW09857.1 hypothetical protein [Enterobacteriaceae bacterium]QIQ12965.1 hypothetical protein [Klebsiella pneumoniae]UFD95102.1 hypothetical protein [Enterobacter hormaechei]UIX51366.1 hypothetical protein [Providencia rettgeri]